MADPFATVADLENRWRPLLPEEIGLAGALLGDASVRIRATCPDVDDRLEAETLDPDLPRMIVVNMVKRSMMVQPIGDGVSSYQTTAGPFSQSVSYANPTGNLYLTKEDRRLLGCGKQRAFSIDLTPPVGPPEGTD